MAQKRGQISPELLKQLAQAKKQPKKRQWHWSLTLTIAGIVAGAIPMLIIKSFTMITYLNLFLGILGIAAVSFLIQWNFFYSQKFIQKHFRMPLGVYALYNVGGISIPIVALLLTLNWLGASSQEEIERHRILGFDRDYVLDSNFDAPFILENNAYAGDPSMRSMPYLMAITKKQNPFLDIVYCKGLLGLNIFIGKRMSPDPDTKPEITEEKVDEPMEASVETTADSTQTDSLPE